jgi:hypothetical protein
MLLLERFVTPRIFFAFLASTLSRNRIQRKNEEAGDCAGPFFTSLLCFFCDQQ